MVQKLQNNYSFYLRQQIKCVTFFYQLFTPISSIKVGEEMTKLINKVMYLCLKDMNHRFVGKIVICKECFLKNTRCSIPHRCLTCHCRITRHTALNVFTEFRVQTVQQWSIIIKQTERHATIALYTMMLCY